jgi:hypothetical protein
VVETGEPLTGDCVDHDDVHGEGWVTRAFDLRIIKLGDGILANWRDVADHRRAEKTMISQAAALRRSQAELEDRVQAVRDRVTRRADQRALFENCLENARYIAGRFG